MNGRERFNAIMNYRFYDRLPVWFFGTWRETKERWKQEGLERVRFQGGSGGPQLPEMDPDWETNPDGVSCIWNNQGLLRYQPVSSDKSEIVEETETTRTIRTPLGGLIKQGMKTTSIPQHLEPDLKPTREDWDRFKSFLNPRDPKRWLDGWEKRMEALNRREHTTCFCAGSFFGWLRDWLGIEAVSYLPYDDPDLYEEMIEYLADYVLELNAQILDRVSFDFGYWHEDCCFNSGPLFSPDIYRKFYDKHYRRVIQSYKDMGVPFILIDSDGKIDDLVGLWLESGFDIVFPVEVGTWTANPVKLRKQYGKALRMMGGVNKHVIPKGETAIRTELEPLKPLVEEGGYIPLPDHRIPPDCSLEQFRVYLQVFRDIFG